MLPDGLDPRLVIDGILVLVLVEFLGLTIWLRRQGMVALLAPFAWFLASGALLMLAVRTALSPGTQSALLMLLLALAGLAHLACLVSTWRLFRRSDRNVE